MHPMNFPGKCANASLDSDIDAKDTAGEEKLIPKDQLTQTKSYGNK